MERRLAAIMVADVVGYSRLIRVDEEGTIAALKALRADLVDPKLAEHHGRIVKLMGDGMLAEFASVVDAVRAAVETQQALAEHNSGLPDDKRIEFRVGINLGDVVIDGDDIHGDGVNIAARLEGRRGRVASASPVASTSKCATVSTWRSRTWASKRSRTSTGRCAFGAGFARPCRRCRRLSG